MMADDDEQCFYYFTFEKPNKVRVNAKIRLKVTVSVGDAIVQAAIAKRLIQQSDDTQQFLERVVAICGEWQLENEYFGDTLQETNSDLTPIAKSTPIVIKLPQEFAPMLPLSSRRSVNDVLRRAGTMEYLDYPANLDEDESDEEGPSGSIQTQLKGRLRFASKKLGLGYTSPEQRTVLEKNINLLADVFCFIQKQWHKLFRVEFPELAPRYKESELLKQVVRCRRQFSMFVAQRSFGMMKSYQVLFCRGGPCTAIRLQLNPRTTIQKYLSEV